MIRIKRTYRVDEVAQQLSLSTRTIERAIARRDILPVKYGRAVRIDNDEIEGFIKKFRLKATGADSTD